MFWLPLLIYLLCWACLVRCLGCVICSHRILSCRMTCPVCAVLFIVRQWDCAWRFPVTWPTIICFPEFKLSVLTWKRHPLKFFISSGIVRKKGKQMKSESVIHVRSRLRVFKGCPNLIPFLSVFFILLVFFIKRAEFVKGKGVQVDLP